MPQDVCVPGILLFCVGVVVSLAASWLLVPRLEWLGEWAGITGFLPGDDPRMKATLDATGARLTDERGLVYRYLAQDGLAGEEGTFRIVLRGRLSERFESAFDGMSLEHGPNRTVLTGDVRDQAQLYGLLGRLQEFGIELLAVEPADGPEVGGSGSGVGLPDSG